MGLNKVFLIKIRHQKFLFNVFKTSFNLTLNEMHFTFLEFQPSYR